MKAFALKETTVIYMVSKLIIKVLYRHKAPKRVISNREPKFTSDVFKKVTKILSIKQSLIVSYFSQANIQTKKVINTLYCTLLRTALHVIIREFLFFLIYKRYSINSVVIDEKWVKY